MKTTNDITSSSAKKSPLLYSAILAPILLAPFGVAQAATFGDNPCTLGGTKACIGGTYNGNTQVGLSDTLDTTPDEKRLTVTGPGFKGAGNNATINANKSILNVGNFGVFGGAYINLDFKDSAYNGGFEVIFPNNKDQTHPSTLTFDGSYQGNSDEALKGYAMKGDIKIGGQGFNGTFKNDANMDGDIILTNPYLKAITLVQINIGFTNSSLTGGIKTPFNDDINGRFKSAKVTFSGNSVSKGYAMKGDITMNVGTLGVDFSNGAKMIGNVRLDGTVFRKETNLNLTFSGSSMEGGGIDLTSSKSNFTLTATKGSKLNLSYLKGTNGGFMDNMTFTLDNSTLQGKTDASAVNYVNTNDIFSLTATNSSKIYMNLTAQKLPNTNDTYSKNTINLTDSEWVGNITTTGGNASANITLKNSKMGNISGDNSGTIVGNFTDSSIGNISDSNASSTLTFATATPATPTADATASAPKPTDHTIGNITFAGKVTGNIANTTIGDITLNSKANITDNLTLTNSFLNSLKMNKGAIINLTLTDSTIGKEGNKDNVIDNYWGTIQANLNKTTINGNVYWQDSAFPNTANSGKGMYFSNKSVLNGNLQAPSDGNVSTDVVFSFDNSTMNGDIILTEKSKDKLTNTVSVNFANNSTFNGNITGPATIKATFDNSTIHSNEISNQNATSTLTFTKVKDSTIGKLDFAGVINGDLTHSDIGTLTNTSKSSSLTLGNQSTDASMLKDAPTDAPINTLGDITFAGTLNGTFYKSTANSFNVSGTSKLAFSDSSKIGALNVSGGTSTLDLTNHSVLGALNVSGGTSNVNLKSGSLMLDTINSSNASAVSNVSFSSIATGDGAIDFTNSQKILQNKLAALSGTGTAPAPDETAKSPESPESSDGDKTAADTASTTPAPAASTAPMASLSKDQLTLLAHSITPADALSYLSMANISSYAGNINTSAGQNNVDFKDSLYLGGHINTTGGSANITLSFSQDFINKLQSDPLTNALLYGGEGPEFFVTTNGENATNNIALSGNIKGVAEFNYIQGNTNIAFADTSSGAFKGGDSTDFSDSAAFDANSSDDTKKAVKINGQTYQTGIYINLDANKADSILKNYRDIFPTNTTTFKIDKISNPNIYTARISGVMVGDVSSLTADSSATAKSYQAIFDNNAVFIGKLNITDRNVSMDLSQGSKLILEDGSNISMLSSPDGSKPFVLSDDGITGDSLYQNNTIIDLATGGVPSKSGHTKDSYSVLNIGEVKNFNNALFRVSYNPFSNATDSAKDKSDHIIINSAKSGSQSDYLQVYQNTNKIFRGDLRDKNILVLSVKNDYAQSDGTKTAGVVFNKESSVLQGYDLVQTTFDTKVESSSDGASSASSTASVPAAATAATSPTAKAATGVSSDTWTNYYIASASSQIAQSSKDLTQAAISSNYSIFLANINDLNKRLGELRNNANAQGVWARVFSGMSTSERGEEVKTYSNNVQVGYDYSIPNSSLDGKSYLGLALSYGYNKLDSSSFSGKANLIEIGAYYSYVGNTGFYNDLILKYSFISNDLNVINNENKNTTFNSSTASLGEELGYRFYFNLKENRTSKHQLYLEPNAEFILGYVGNGGFDQVNGNAFLDASIDNILAFRGRVGGVLGYSLTTAHNQTDFRVGLSYVGDIVGGGNMNFKTNFSDAQLNLQSNQMALVSVGVNSIISDNWKVYADVDTSFAGKYYNQNYLVSVGGRYAFGKKVRFTQENRPSSDKDQSQSPSAAKSIKAGYYFDVYALAKNAKLTKEQMALLSKYPYAISIEQQTYTDPNTQAKKTIEVQKILIGPFKSKEGALQSQKIADEIAKILNQKPTQATLREVK